MSTNIEQKNETLKTAKKALEFNLIDISSRLLKDKENEFLLSLYTSTKKSIEKIERSLAEPQEAEMWWDDNEGCQHSDEMQYSEPQNEVA